MAGEFQQLGDIGETVEFTISEKKFLVMGTDNRARIVEAIKKNNGQIVRNYSKSIHFLVAGAVNRTTERAKNDKIPVVEGNDFFQKFNIEESNFVDTAESNS